MPTAAQNKLDARSVTNTPTAHAQFGTATADSNTYTLSLHDALPISLTLKKSTTTATYAAVGDTISYSYKLTNSGNVTLSSPYTVNDDKATVTCPTIGRAHV